MRISFRYRMEIEFGAQVTGHEFLLRCMPRDDMRQTIYRKEMSVSPEADMIWSTDPYGNITAEGTIPGPQSSFSVDLSGDAEIAVSKCPIPVRRESDWDREKFLGQTALTAPGPCLEALASEVSGDDASQTVVSAMDVIREAMPYTKGITDPSTTAEQALEIGGGVCQDIAQAMVSVLRMNGISACYVAGLASGEGETHAWVEYLDDGIWYGADPTAGRFVSGPYLKFSHGRDSSECRINKGVFTGYDRGRQSIRANLDVVSRDAEQRVHDRDGS